MIPKRANNMLIVLPIFILLAGVGHGQAGSGPLQVRELGTERIEMPSVSYPLFRHDSTGNLYFLTADGWGVHRVWRATRLLTPISLHGISEAGNSTVSFAGDLTIDVSGNIYVPAMWEEWQTKKRLAGVFVIDPMGRHVRTITFPAFVNVRRLVTDEIGNVYALSFDPRYFRGQAERCLLIRKYSPSGGLLVEFSEYPEEFKIRDLTSSDFGRFRLDVDRGHLWIEKEALFQVLPTLRVLRMFALNGKLIEEIQFVPPQAGDILAKYNFANATTADDRIWRIVRLPKGRYFIEWAHSESIGQRKTSARYWCQHDAAGRPLSEATPLPARPTAPIYSDENYTYFLRVVSPTANEIVKAEVIVGGGLAPE